MLRKGTFGRTSSSYTVHLLTLVSLFQVAAGREWYIHTIYTVRSKENANRGIGKRSLEYHHSMSMASPSATHDNLPALPSSLARSRRAAGPEVPALAENIGPDNNRGTNIMHISLDRSRRRAGPRDDGALADNTLPREQGSKRGEEDAVTVAGAMVGLLLTVLLVVALALLLRSRQTGAGKMAPKPSGSKQQMMVTDKSYDSADSSEV